MKRNQVIFVSFFLLVTFLLGIVSRAPKTASQSGAVSEVDIEINEAIHMVQSGNPMEGILKLRSLLDDYPENPRIHFELGQFSITSGQNQKAIQRFEKVLTLDNENYPEAYFFLGRVQIEEGMVQKGIENLKIYQSFASDSVIINGIERMIQEIINQ